jgi:CBS domain-containing protein
VSIAPKRSIFGGVRVRTAMRRQVIAGRLNSSLAACINQMVKHKVGAVLILDDLNSPAGVVSKTDLISAYYTMLPVDTPAGDLMAREPVFCYADDLIEDAIDRMRTHGINRIYVRDKMIDEMIGTLSYLDVVGLLYRYCRKCPRSIFGHQQEDGESVDRLRVREVMSTTLHTCRKIPIFQYPLIAFFDPGLMR